MPHSVVGGKQTTSMAKLFFLFLIAANFGLPLNSWASFIFLLIAFGIVLIGEIKSGRRLWGWAMAVTAVVIALRLALPSHEIKEGHAVFFPGNEMQSVLPEDVFQSMRRHHDDLELEFKIRPDPRGWAFSMDAIWRDSDLSRWREDLDFDDRWKARFGALNDVRHNYYRNGLSGYGAYLPLAFRFDLPASTMGGELCWRGTVYWPTAEGVHERISNDEWRCRKISSDFSARFLTVYAEDFEPGTALSMRLQGTGFFDYGPLVRHGLGIIGALATIFLLGRIKPAGLFLVLGSVAAILVSLARRALTEGTPSELSSMVYMERGNDGLVHYGLGREIVTAALDGRWEQALRGGENIFFFMPGLRYVWSMLMPLFGETFFGYWLIIGLLPFLMALLLRRFVKDQWVGVLLVCFVLIPIFNSLGFFQFQYARLAVRGYAGAMAWMAMLSAIILIWPFFSNHNQRSTGSLFAAGFLFAVAVACRPNLAPGVAVLAGGAVLALVMKENWQTPGFVKAGTLALGASVILLVTLHNWYFGGDFVLLTRSIDISANLAVPPVRYVEFLQALMSGSEDAGERFRQISENLMIWIDVHEVWLQIPYITLWVALLWPGTPPVIRIFSLAVIANHGVFLFYRGIPRYTYGTWLMTLLVFFWAFREIYWPFLVRRWPKLDRLSRLPAQTTHLSPFYDSTNGR